MYAPMTLAAAAALALSGCVGQPVEHTSARSSTSPVCIPVQDLSEWELVDEISIVLISPDNSRAYLLRLTLPIEGLDEAGDIDVVDADHDGRICPAGPDGVMAADCGCATAGIASIRVLDTVPPILDRYSRLIGSGRGRHR
jgi:hypothetical protein